MKGKNWQDAGNADLLTPGQPVLEGKLLFEKIEDHVIEQQVQKLHDAKRLNELEGKTVAPVKSEIQYDDFAKMDIRIATILEAENVPKSKKLLKLLIDIGSEQRTVLSGISEHFKAEYGTEALRYASVSVVGFYLLAAALMLFAIRRLREDWVEDEPV